MEKNNSKNTDFQSNTGAYKIRCQNRNKFYIRDTSKNLYKSIYEHKKRLWNS